MHDLTLCSNGRIAAYPPSAARGGIAAAGQRARVGAAGPWARHDGSGSERAVKADRHGTVATAPAPFSSLPLAARRIAPARTCAHLHIAANGRGVRVAKRRVHHAEREGLFGDAGRGCLRRVPVARTPLGPRQVRCARLRVLHSTLAGCMAGIWPGALTRRCLSQRTAQQRSPARAVRDGLQPHVRATLGHASGVRPRVVGSRADCSRRRGAAFTASAWWNAASTRRPACRVRFAGQGCQRG